MDLAVFDSLVHFLPPGAENNADLLVESLAPLRALAEAGVAVLAMHHPAKHCASADHAARGTVALPGGQIATARCGRHNPHNPSRRPSFPPPPRILPFCL